MTVQPPPKAAFSDNDLQELAALLEMRAVPFKGMSLEMLDGFLSALFVGPDVVMPSEWTPPVWGGRPPRWESVEEASHVNGLLLALWNDVSRRVALDPDTLRDRDLPLIALPDQPDVEPDEADDYGAEWATGFVDGVKLRVDAWGVWCAKDAWIDSLLVGIETIASGEWMATEVGATAEPLSASDRLELIGGLPYMLHDLHMHRIEGAVSRTPIRREAAPGRNDPCPCGSGRKFKKCCGAGPTVH
jgi:uncharacterized protein